MITNQEFFNQYMSDIQASAGAEEDFCEVQFTEEMCNFLVQEAVINDFDSVFYNKSNENTTNSSISNNINLSEETTILADIRSNSILIMGEEKDIIAIKQVITKLDVKLEQVMIEAGFLSGTSQA